MSVPVGSDGAGGCREERVKQKSLRDLERPGRRAGGDDSEGDTGPATGNRLDDTVTSG